MKNTRSRSWKSSSSKNTQANVNKNSNNNSIIKLPIIKKIIGNEKKEEQKNNNSDNEYNNEKIQKKSCKMVTGAEEWLAWCTENKVLVGQTIELTHYEIEACRRHFTNLKFHPSDEGVHPKTLADSFHRAEVFATFNESLLFCQKLGKNSDSLLTFTDLLNAVHGTSIFKRNKVTSYMKFVSSSELFDYSTPLVTDMTNADAPSTAASQRRSSKPENIFQKNKLHL